MAEQTAPGGGRGRRGDLRRRRARRRLGAGPRHRALPAQRRQERCCSPSTRPRAWPSRRCSAEFHELGLGEPQPVSAAHGQGIGSLAEAALDAALGRARPTSDDDEPVSSERRRRADPAGRRRPAERRQVDADQRLARRGAAGRLRPAGHDARRDRRAVRARRPPLRPDRHRRPAPQAARCSRRSRSSRSSRRCRRSPTPTSSLLLLDATQGVTDQDAHIAGYILESGRAVVVAVNKWDAVDGYQKRDARALDRAAPAVPASSRRCSTSRRAKRQGFGPVWKAIADAHASATRKMPTPVLTRLLQEAVRAPEPEARRRVPPEAALRAPGRHEPAGRSSSTATRSST